MSYFPCDIPFMSDEELKENGINIPKKRITNREKLVKMSNYEIAEEMCHKIECSYCPFEEECYSLDDVLPMNGFLKWLEEEVEEDND